MGFYIYVTKTRYALHLEYILFLSCLPLLYPEIWMEVFYVIRDKPCKKAIWRPSVIFD
jgi:hypothetical protein